ncbi:PAS domain-containing protein [Dongia mobilis]|uniref:PAS domain-containing protein n=1 Tax=Dongia mobilis TaxID=578943 RepID=A0A4R6X066_9PROT|nr:PAS domain-containing protein [Dongia mobilis]TDQ83828.1 PAS domain-containing protein [Dongia mobilis]
MENWRETCHPDVLAVLRYWEEKRGDRAMPARGDIDPAEIRRYLPHITLVDVVDDPRRYVYRLVGTQEVELRGYDPTGRAVGDAYFASSAEAALANYDEVCRIRAPLYVADPFQVVDRYVGEEDLFLPLSSDGERVTMILVFSIATDLHQAPPFGM